jgi:hypothetical protein
VAAGRAERVEVRAASWRVRRARARGPGSMGGCGSGCGGWAGCGSVGWEGSGSGVAVVVGILWRGREAWWISSVWELRS